MIRPRLPELPPWRQRMPGAPWPLGEHGSAAHHEAGHLVTARLVGFAPGNAVVGQENGGRATIGITGKTPDPIDESALEQPMPPVESYADLFGETFEETWPRISGGRSRLESAFDYTTVLLAGRQAELIHAGIEIKEPCVFVLSDSDHDIAIAILARVEELAALGWLQKRARELLTAHWPEVEQQADLIQQAANTTEAAAIA
ncbi:hypothetical protein [Guyparkeria sp.]|uniref:hypothetical protein n=1 Tax=Guyparkeria sp. TaxID=2035736 RepID=UPI00397112CA